jgi:uncharacterized membrane protein
MRASRAVLLLLAAAGVVQLLYYHPLLPQNVASHFDGAGEANGFQSRNGFVALSGSVLILMVVLFGGLGALFRTIPSSWFNLPNRDYWLAPERREETLDEILRRMEWLGAVSLGLWLFIIQMVLETNLTPEPRLEARATWIVLGLYLAYTAVWAVRFLLRFRKPAG